jgi:hypothetical protein
MAVRHISENELARDLHSVLDQVERGAEIVVERGSKPIATMTSVISGRSLDECIALARSYEKRLGFAPVADPTFADDVRSAIDAHREPLNPLAWE